MKKENKKLFIIILILGIFVPLSYIYAGSTFHEGLDAFWGDFNKEYLPYYYGSMIVSTIGYFIFTTYILFKLNKTNFHISDKFNYSFFKPLYIILLVGSALWMPVVKEYLLSASLLLWIATRIILFLVGVAALGIFLMLILNDKKGRGLFEKLAIMFSAVFFIHTGILDAFIWPAFFNN